MRHATSGQKVQVIQCHVTAVIVKWINTLLLLLGLTILVSPFFGSFFLFFITGTCKCRRRVGWWRGLTTFGPYHATVRSLRPQVQKSPREPGRAIRIPGHVHSSWTSRNINRKVSQKQPGGVWRKRTTTKQQPLKRPCVIEPLSQPRARDDGKSGVSNI